MEPKHTDNKEDGRFQVLVLYEYKVPVITHQLGAYFVLYVWAVRLMDGKDDKYFFSVVGSLSFRQNWMMISMVYTVRT